MKFEDLIKQKRFELKENQTEFGERFDVSHVAVSDWELGKSEAPYKVIYFCMQKELPKTSQGLLILFGYPMDNSIRAEVAHGLEEYRRIMSEYKEIRYFICSFYADNIVTKPL